MYRTYYTLRRKNDLIYPGEFETYEDAYEKMVQIYLNSGKTVRFGIWETRVSGNNSMTQAVWEG